MNKFLKSAAERFSQLTKSKSYLINPLSEIDCEIIDEIKVILSKYEASEVIEILRNYKEYKDEEIRDDLLQWNIDHPSIDSKSTYNDEQSDTKSRKNFIRIQDDYINVNFIFGFRLIDHFVENEESYHIMLNPTPDDVTKIPLYSNHCIEFSDFESREKFVSNLKKVFKEFKINFIEL